MLSDYFMMQGPLPAFSPKVPYHDKLSHAVYGGVVGLFGAYVGQKVGISPYTAALGSSLIIAIAKEVYDEKVRNKTIETSDILATVSLPIIALVIKSIM